MPRRPASHLKPYEQLSYLGQVSLLRKMAELAVKKYFKTYDSLQFIRHGENATFKVSSRGYHYLLRLHRPNYHSPSAIREELKVLRHLKGSDQLVVPQPIRSLAGDELATIELPIPLPLRRVATVNAWVDGHFVKKSLAPRHAFELGKTLGLLHRETRHFKLSERRYWTAEGLVGKCPKLGPVDKVLHLKAHEQALITQARKHCFKKVQAYQESYPRRMGFVHADLHFGNFLWRQGSIGVIDFDDSGWGSRVYDLAVTRHALEGMLKHLKIRGGDERFIEELYRGYSDFYSLDAPDLKMIPIFCGVRRIAMLGWLLSRNDHPRLRAYIPKGIRQTLTYLRNEF